MSLVIKGKLGETVMFLLAIITILGLAILSISYPTDEYFIGNNMPIPKYGLKDLIVAFIGLIVVIKAWGSCGSDHKENVGPEHPDGKLTYPIGIRDWWKEKKENE